MSPDTIKNKNEEISIKEIAAVVGRYKFSIIMITFLFALVAGIYVYIAPKVYQTQTTIEIQPDRSAPQYDIVSLATGGNANIDNEIAIIRSRSLILDALKSLNLGIRYYTKENYKTIELYKNSPFVVNYKYISKNARSYKYRVIPVSKETFRLIVEPTWKQEITDKILSYFDGEKKTTKPIHYNKEHKYGEDIETPWFSLNIQKIFEPSNKEYSFLIGSQVSMMGYVLNNLIVAPLTEKGTTISLVFEDRVPLRAKEILNAIVDAYINKTLEIKTESEERKLRFIDSQLEAISKTLQKSAEKLQKYKATNIVTDVGEKAALTSEKLSDLQRQLYEIDMRLGVLQNILQYIESHKDIKGIDVDLTQQLSPTINTLILKLQEANELRTTLLTDYTELHPDVIKVTKQLNSLKQSLVQALKSAIRSLENRKQTLLGIIEENEKLLKELPEQERQLAKLTRSFMVNEKIYSYLLEKRAETAIAASSTLPKARVIDYPFMPDAPVRPLPVLIITIAILLGLIVGIVLAFFRDAMDDTIKSSNDLSKLTKIPLYGAIPYLNGRKNISTFHEALRVVRTNLEFLQNSGKSKLITVTSTVPKEGKTTFTTELAKIIAKSGKKVIVLDLDMRQSKVHKMYNIPNKEGLSTLLAGKNTIKEVVQSTNEDNLYVITSGPKPPDPSELLMSEEFKKVVQKLLTEYDYVLLDSPPIGLVTDAMIPMRMSDINLFVVRAEYSKKEFILNINRIVREHELKAGLILNAVKIPAKQGAYGYGYGVSYGGHAGNYYS